MQTLGNPHIFTSTFRLPYMGMTSKENRRFLTISQYVYSWEFLPERFLEHQTHPQISNEFQFLEKKKLKIKSEEVEFSYDIM